MAKINKSSHGKHGVTTQQRGIALIEAMVALLIVSLGALGLIGMHLFLNRNADVAKQRSEAAKLAQGEMENMRVYRTATPSSDALFWTNVIKTDATGAEIKTGTASSPYTSNTAYTLQRSVPASAPTAGNYRDVQVKVTWPDRSGENQALVFRSIMNGVDPATAVSLSLVPNGSNVRDTLGRNVSIPIPSKNLGDGTSVFKPKSGDDTAIVFDNTTGLIKKTCRITKTIQSAQITLADLTDCTNKIAYLLSGFIRFKSVDLKSNFVSTDANDPVPTNTTWSVNMIMNDATPLPGSALPTQKHGLLSLLSKNSAAWTTTISNSRYPSAPKCAAESLKTIKFTAAVDYSFTNNGSTTPTTSTTVYLTIPESTALTPTAIAPYTIYPAEKIINTSIVDLSEYYVGYSCVIEPIDLDNDPLTANAWTGITQLSVSGTGTASSASIGTTYKICRFSADYNLSYNPSFPYSSSNYPIWYPVSPTPDAATNQNIDRINNEEHPYAYLNVQRSLSNQNFLVINGSNSCPSGSAVEVNGTGSEVYTDTTTVLHQP
ncbi:hypothetical protein [Acidovorax soli]|uniref:Type IV pilus modification protein PilV n=1 Tax=Acidovorax soli TaxID=592050 RepID=A0A1H3WY97_9BURK|nr:hypothetical protein [Acidovorax soli]SDZ91920.1 type IV pilus modification protein PilV [Acidovorax soli]